MLRLQSARVADGPRAVIRRILSELPEEHPAHQAYRGGADAIELTRLVEREDLADQLSEAWLDWYTQRVRRRQKAV